MELPQDHVPQALIALHRGQFAQARDHSMRALVLADGMMLPTPTAVLGIADLWSGRADDALARLASIEQVEAHRGILEPGMFVGRAEYIEALLQLGRIADAERVSGDWEAAATRVNREWTLAEVVRSKGLIAAARGEVDRASTSWRRQPTAMRRPVIPSPGVGRCSRSAACDAVSARSGWRGERWRMPTRCSRRSAP
jgi:hypothetical protein